MATFKSGSAPQGFEWSLQWKNWLSQKFSDLSTFFASPEFPELSTNELSVEGNTLIEGSLDVDGDVSGNDAAFAGEVTVGEDVTIGEDLRVEGEAFGSAGINIQGSISSATGATTLTFPVVPSWVKRINLILSGVSTNGSSQVRLRTVIESGPVTSGYLGCAASLTGSTVSTFTAGFDTLGTADTAIRHGRMVLNRANAESTVWECSWRIGRSDVSNGDHGEGVVTMSGALTSFVLTTVGGANTFDAGTIYYTYE